MGPTYDDPPTTTGALNILVDKGNQHPQQAVDKDPAYSQPEET
jgi:hypothetical protein